MSNAYTKTYEINYSDADPNLRCRIASIMNFICDIGTNQSEALGDTIERLMEKKYAWVFYKYDIKINRYPKYREKISITTEPCGFKKFYAYRKYIIKDQANEVIGEGMALFFLIDFKKRRPIRIPKEEYELYGVDFDLDKNLEMEEIHSTDIEENIKEYAVRYSDIDSNGHVNNVKYIEWAIESVPLEIVKNFEIKRAKIIFEKETKYGEIIKVSCSFLSREEDKIVTTHVIKNNEGKELTKLELEWQKE